MKVCPEILKCMYTHKHRLKIQKSQNKD